MREEVLKKDKALNS